MTDQSKNDLILDTWRACDSVFKYAQDRQILKVHAEFYKDTV